VGMAGEIWRLISAGFPEDEVRQAVTVRTSSTIPWRDSVPPSGRGVYEKCGRGGPYWPGIWQGRIGERIGAGDVDGLVRGKSRLPVRLKLPRCVAL